MAILTHYHVLAAGAAGVPKLHHSSHNPRASTTAVHRKVRDHDAALLASSFCPSPWLAVFSVPLTNESASKAGRLRVSAFRSKGFGDMVRKSRNGTEEGKKASRPNACPCGGGTEQREYAACCAPFHGGVVESDALTLMKARFSAYSLGVVPYVVRTTHPDNPAFESAEKLADDVHATCARLRFYKLDVLDFKEVSDSEAFVSFVASYNLVKGGRGGERKQLREESRFVREDGRWLYRDGDVSQASEAAWIAATTPNFVEPQVSRKAFAKSRAPIGSQAPKTLPRGF